MTKKTHIQGNDAALEDSIDTLKKTILNADFNIVEQFWLNTIANNWSVTLCDRDCPLLSSKGHGATKKAALANALSEFAERLSTHNFWTSYYLGGEVANCKYVHSSQEKWFRVNTNSSWPDGVFNGETGKGLRHFYDPINELNVSSLIDINSANNERGISCIPYECLNTGEIINFPVNIIDNLYANNGISSGSSLEEAGASALSEIIEHYIKFKIIAEGVSLPNVPNNVLSLYPIVKTCISEIETKGYSLLVQDASFGGKYPVVAVTLLDSINQGVYSCFAADPKFGVALERSLTKLFQGLILEQKGMLAEAGFDMDEIASSDNLERHFLTIGGNQFSHKAINKKSSNGIVPWVFLNDKADYDFVDWGKHDVNSRNDNSANVAEEFNQLCDLIHAEGNDIFISEYNVIGVYVCRIIIPGLSEIYPVDNLIFENNNMGNEVRGQILKMDKTAEECEQLIEDLEELNLDDEYLVSSLIGMQSDDDIFRDLCIAELITLLALKIQDNERIQEGCEWLLHFQKINSRRLKTYQCINTILQLDVMTDYANALERLYTRSVLNDALALIDGEDIFQLVSDWEMHGLLVEAYRKVTKT
ncbi:MAG: ribosomal protein S12 methylthiotransferase accessory factor [Cocleimonas sp.]|jgi:ribosomal protein S12 methylthiotransferase accessory factor